MHEASLLVWLKVRHIRSACAYWGYMFGADIESKPDLIDKLYYLYLLVLLGAWTASTWMFAVSSVEEAYAFGGTILLDITGALLVFSLLAVLVLRCALSVRTYGFWSLMFAPSGSLH